MAIARERLARRHAVWQSAALFGEGLDVGEFVHTGHVGDGDCDERLPYNPQVLQALQNQLDERQGRR